MIEKAEKSSMKTARILILIFIVQLFIFTPILNANGKVTDTVSSQIRCSVCGMFVAKYPNWLAQIHYDGLVQAKFFDGVKDMMVFYFNPERYESPPREAIKNIYVKDYYSLNWLLAIDAFYVVGSDVYGPMGHELIPFASKEAAESFSKDHHGKEILTFDEITPELINSLRLGQRMR
jgi:nitrous oxide reductase accessory protein NosL